MQPDFISVIVPVYNIEPYVERCIRSILSQTYNNLEVIIINDGSTDNSGSICHRLALSDSRIRVIDQKNAGLSEARNTGLRIAQGTYIAFVDGDDYIDESGSRPLHQPTAQTLEPSDKGHTHTPLVTLQLAFHGTIAGRRHLLPGNVCSY